jgi:hypothetical protein
MLFTSSKSLSCKGTNRPPEAIVSIEGNLGQPRTKRPPVGSTLPTHFWTIARTLGSDDLGLPSRPPTYHERQQGALDS